LEGKGRVNQERLYNAKISTNMINDKYIELIKDEHKRSYLEYKRGNTILSAYSSHQPVLIHVLNTITKGKVLEYGVGWHSSPIMHTICGMQGRKLISVDTDKIWMNKFADYKNDNHELLFLREQELGKWKHEIFKSNYSIAFIDGAPGLMRQVFIEKTMDYVDYFVVHDTEEVSRGVKYPFPSPYNWNFSMFKHVYHLKREGPGVSVLSNVDEFNKDLLAIFE